MTYLYFYKPDAYNSLFCQIIFPGLELAEQQNTVEDASCLPIMAITGQSVFDISLYNISIKCRPQINARFCNGQKIDNYCGVCNRKFSAMDVGDLVLSDFLLKRVSPCKRRSKSL